MGPIEHILSVLCLAIERDEISKGELRRTLGLLGTLVDELPGNDSEELRAMSVDLGERFEFLFRIYYDTTGAKK